MALILARLLLSLMTVAGPAAVAAPQPEARPRLVQLAAGAKVTTVSSGADEVIEVAAGIAGPYAVPVGIETGAQAIEHAAAWSDVIVLADIQRLAGRLIEEDTWIATDVTAPVIDLVSGSHRAGGLKPGDRLTFTERGGEIVDRRTTIRTKPELYTPMRVGGRYLLFLSRGSDAADAPAFDVGTRLEITGNGTVRDMIVPQALAWQTRMTGLSVDRAVAVARSAALRPRILHQRTGIPLSARITPDDRLIVLQRAPSPAPQHEGQVDPDVPSDVALTMLTGLSTAVAVIDVTSSTARLVEGESWLATTTTARIVDAIKPGSYYRSLKPGPLTIEDDGGEMRMQNAIVHTGTDGGFYREAYVPGRRYLVFMTFHPALDAAVSLAAYEVRAGGTLGDLFAGRKGLDYRQQLDGLALTQTVETIRRLTRAGY